MADRISITLVAGDIALDPEADGTIAFGSPRWLRAKRVPNATRYCWTLTQDTRAVEVCRPGSKAPMKDPDSMLAGFEGGAMSLQVRAEAGGSVIGRQTITVMLDVHGASPS